MDPPHPGDVTTLHVYKSTAYCTVGPWHWQFDRVRSITSHWHWYDHSNWCHRCLHLLAAGDTLHLFETLITNGRGLVPVI